jgi:hypothetical protein
MNTKNTIVKVILLISTKLTILGTFEKTNLEFIYKNSFRLGNATHYLAT